ncbi:metalloprotease [Candidatus Woesearchaeota archaeon]|nr:metalloprotease [Candidatus Woesearchaeota archaeon]
MPLHFSSTELRDLAKAWIAISLAFAIAFGRLSFDARFLAVLGISAITVGIGFLLHELGHKVVAQHYGLWAEFRSFDAMLLLAIALSFAGFIFAAPGAVMIGGQHVDRKRNGHISIAGPAVNIALSLFFLALALVSPEGVLRVIGAYGSQVNAWLAVFNLIPFFALDGYKVWAWNKGVYALAMIAAVGVMVLQGMV